MIEQELCQTPVEFCKPLFRFTFESGMLPSPGLLRRSL
jgi:hypothetical protein